MNRLSPSILSSDFSDLKSEIYKIEKGGADYIHLDIMDGHFVPNISFGAPIIKSLRKITDLPFDTHLMIENPDKYIKDFSDAGSDILTIHQESTKHLNRTIQLIKSYGMKAGVSLNPATPVDSLKYIIDDIDLILIMSVNPGFGGQSFIPQSIDKIKETRKLINSVNKDIILEVDGGIKLENVRDVINAGADMVVVGSDIFGAPDVISRTKEFKEKIQI